MAWRRARQRLTRSADIAFSTSFLRSNNPAVIHPDIGFHVVVVGAGAAHRLDACPSRIRIVSIADGKVRARMPDEEEFVINANGAVKVFHDTACVLENRVSADATLHICTLPQ